MGCHWAARKSLEIGEPVGMKLPKFARSALTRRRERTAVAVLVLVTDYPSWVHRRLESIEILDDSSVHRRVSIDLEIPTRLIDPEDLPFVPLTFLNKEVLRNFDLRDHEGHPIPMLTKSENGQLAGDTLVAAAEAVLNRVLPGPGSQGHRTELEAELVATFGPAGRANQGFARHPMPTGQGS